MRLYNPGSNTIETYETMEAVVKRFYEHSLPFKCIMEKSVMPREFV